jgi:flagellar biosynthesis protein FlhG
LVNFMVDQAEGLRRVLAASRTRTVAVVAGTRGAGATSCIVNLARALTRSGRRVLIVDENHSSSNVAATLGLQARFDLKQVIEGYCPLSDALLHGADGITVLPASRAAVALPKLDVLMEQRAVKCFEDLERNADIVLVDVRNDAEEPSAFANAAQEVVVVVSPGPSSITGGYTAMKRMSQSGRKRFHLLVNRSHDGDADLVYRNMAHAAATHLDVALEFMGAIPQDPAVSAAACRYAPAFAAPFADVTRRFSAPASAMLRWSPPKDETSRLDNFMQRAIYGSRLIAAGAGA